MPVGTPMCPQWANGPWYSTNTDQDNNNELDLEWICQVVAELQRPQDSRSPYYAHGHDNVGLICKGPSCCTGQDGPNEFDWEWICHVVIMLTGPAIFQEPLLCPWAYLFGPNGKWPQRCSCTGQDSSNELDLEWIGLLVAELWLPKASKSSHYAHGHTHVAQMGKWPWCRRCTGQDSFNELDLE